MADLLDIASSSSVEIVKIDDLEFKVRGVSADGIASIVSRFPELIPLVNGSVTESLIPRLIASCGAAVGPIIAIGCGHRDEEAYEQCGATLPLEQQIKLLDAIFRLTFPNGIGRFVEKLKAMIGGAAEQPKIVRVRLKKSPSASPPSSGADSRPIMQ